MVLDKKDFFKLIQANIVAIRSLMEMDQLLGALPPKICECVRAKDKNLGQFAELFERKVVEREATQAEQRAMAKELKEAQTRLFAILPNSQTVEKVSLSEREALNAKLGRFFDHATELQDDLANFREKHEGPTDVDGCLQNFTDVMNGLQFLLEDCQSL